MPLDKDLLLRPVKRLRKLIKQAGSEPDPDFIHELRTNTRRLETICRTLLPDGDGTGAPTSLLKNLARLRRRAGRVRDMDVLTAEASAVVNPQKKEKEYLALLLEHLAAQRRKHAGKLHSEIQRRRPAMRQELKRTAAILAKRIGESADGPKGRDAAANATAAAVRIVAGLALPQRLDKETLHPWRLKVKELRNVLQMATGADRLRFVEDLGNVKDAVGEWHDAEELITTARKALDHGNRSGLPAEWKRIEKRRYEHALSLAGTLRETYLGHRRHPGKNTAVSSPKTLSGPVRKAIALLST